MKDKIKNPKALKISNVILSFIESFNGEFLLEDTQNLSLKINNYSLDLIESTILSGDINAAKALLYLYFPHKFENNKSEIIDSQGEELELSHPSKLITNFFKNRVLFFISDDCPNHCRFCFRREKIGKYKTIKGYDASQDNYNSAIQYIESNKNIKEVILSGGEPFAISNSKLKYIIEKLRQIERIKLIRIDTKVFTTFPERINSETIDILANNKPVFVIGNFVHPSEISKRTINATSKLIDAGIPVLSHTPLLKNINNDTQILEELFYKLVTNRIIPHYLVHYIPTKHTEHFNVPIKEGTEIYSRLLGNLSGVAMPKYILCLPEGGGKVHLTKSRLIDTQSNGYLFESFEGRKIFYPEEII